MASVAVHIKYAHIAMLEVCDKLGKQFGVPAPVLPYTSRHGAEHTNRVQWETLLAWLGEQSSAPADDGVITIEVDYEPDTDAPVETNTLAYSDEPYTPSNILITGVNRDTGEYTYDVLSESERLAAIVGTSDEPVPDEPGTVDTPVPDDGYETMTKRDLLTLAESRGLTVIGSGDRGYIKNEDVIEALRHAAANG